MNRTISGPSPNAESATRIRCKRSHRSPTISSMPYSRSLAPLHQRVVTPRAARPLRDTSPVGPLRGTGRHAARQLGPTGEQRCSVSKNQAGQTAIPALYGRMERAAADNVVTRDKVDGRQRNVSLCSACQFTISAFLLNYGSRHAKRSESVSPPTTPAGAETRRRRG